MGISYRMFSYSRDMFKFTLVSVLGLVVSIVAHFCKDSGKGGFEAEQSLLALEEQDHVFLYQRSGYPQFVRSVSLIYSVPISRLLTWPRVPLWVKLTFHVGHIPVSVDEV